MRGTDLTSSKRDGKRLYELVEVSLWCERDIASARNKLSKVGLLGSNPLKQYNRIELLPNHAEPRPRFVVDVHPRPFGLMSPQDLVT